MLKARRSISRSFRSLLLSHCLLLTATLPVVSGCQEKIYKSGDPSNPSHPTRHWVEGLHQRLDAPLKEHVETQVSQRALATRLKRANKLSWSKRIATDIKYADLFEKIYEEAHYKKVMVNHRGLTSKGKLVLERIKAFERHRIEEPMNYHIARIEEIDGTLQELASKMREPAPVTLEPGEIEGLILFAEARGIAPYEENSQLALLEALAMAPDTPEHPAPRIATMMHELREQIKETAELTAELELLVSDGMLRYARDMRHFNLNRMNWNELKNAGGSRKVIYDRLEATLRAMREAQTGEEISAVLDALLPPHPDYMKLVEMRERYQHHLTTQSWPRVSPFNIAEQTSSPHAPALKTRLFIEGYLPRDTTEESLKSELVDASLVEAVTRYHALHDLEFKAPRAHNTFWKNLRKDPKQQLQLIDLNLERLRASRYDGERDYVSVNLPDFHAELYEDGARTMRFKVVIGKNDRKCDPETSKFIYPNATPELHSKLEHFILNPSWYVPERIIEEEIKPNVEKDETWLEKNNYEIVKKRGDSWTVRQTPGPHNALGLVKFIFPNPHNTYMHDTAKKEYFDYARRAYSHGCMRVHEPLDFAKKLLQFDGQDAEVDIQAVLDAKQSRMIKLEKELAVFVEYHTIQFDPESGAARFLGDIYRHDRRALSGNPEAYDACKSVVASADDDEENDATPANTAGDLGP